MLASAQVGHDAEDLRPTDIYAGTTGYCVEEGVRKATYALFNGGVWINEHNIDPYILHKLHDSLFGTHRGLTRQEAARVWEFAMGAY